jgi:hypothetical protein
LLPVHGLVDFSMKLIYNHIIEQMYCDVQVTFDTNKAKRQKREAMKWITVELEKLSLL